MTGLDAQELSLPQAKQVVVQELGGKLDFAEHIVCWKEVGEEIGGLGERWWVAYPTDYFAGLFMITQLYSTFSKILHDIIHSEQVLQ